MEEEKLTFSITMYSAPTGFDASEFRPLRRM
jgi:hypothetical protein